MIVGLILKFLYIDDERVFMEKNIPVINNFFEKEGYHIQWDCLTEIPEVIDFKKYDVCFLDIEVNGVNMLDYIYDCIMSTFIICVSQYDFYVHDAIHLHIFDFIRKSHFDRDIYNCLNGLITRLKLDKIETLKCNGEMIGIKVREISYIDIYSHRCIIHMIYGEEYEIKKDYSKLFQNKHECIVRVHNYHAVNLDNCIKLVGDKISVLGATNTINISRDRREEFKDKFFKNMISCK